MRPTTRSRHPALWLLLLALAAGLTRAQLPLHASDDADDRKTYSSDESACAENCAFERPRPVCGTDGRTYESRCELQRQNCEGNPVQLKHKGRCTTEGPRCFAHIAQSQKTIELHSSQQAADLTPDCPEDGKSATVQCLPPTVYCWCVTETGKLIHVMNKMPNCEKSKVKPNDKRRSRRKDKKVCTQQDRTNFKENLVKTFLFEYNRLPTSSTPTAKEPSLLDPRNKLAVDWKFTELDRNGDQNLDREELQALKRMLKKVVRPKACARTFTRHCDQNQDQKISLSEWSVCVGVDMDDENTEQSNRGDGYPNKKATVPGLPILNTQLTTLSAQVRPTDSNVDETDEELKDCPTERQIALEEQRVAGSRPFVPECTSDGKYSKIQCFKPAGYCWCVDPETGKTISGQWSHNSKPDCSKDAKQNKSIKGCPDRKKSIFIKDLMAFMLSDLMSPNVSSALKEPMLQQAKERATKRKFQQIDSNHNQVIDKKEWKDFKNDIKKKKNLRKCGRNFLKFCDDNNDKKVTLEEWIACMDMKIGHKRSGTNPLTKYLQQ